MTEPFLKWVGGKRGVLEQLRPLLPPSAGARGYRQPFMGGGSPFWQIYAAVRPAVLSDTNERLVDCYLAVRDHVEDLIAELRIHESAYDGAYYYDIREALNARTGTIVQRAGYFFVINKWGFNGLCRVNTNGQCNVAFGRTASGKPPVLCDESALRACSRALQSVDIRHEDFAATLTDARDGEVVYIDPPYHPVSETADFTSYTSDGFSYRTTPQAGLFAEQPTDHERLLAVLRDMDRRGVAWALSNADTPATRSLYAAWEIATVRRSGGINSDPTKRGKVGEIVVRGRVASRSSGRIGSSGAIAHEQALNAGRRER